MRDRPAPGRENRKPPSTLLLTGLADSLAPRFQRMEIRRIHRNINDQKALARVQAGGDLIKFRRMKTRAGRIEQRDSMGAAQHLIGGVLMNHTVRSGDNLEPATRIAPMPSPRDA